MNSLSVVIPTKNRSAALARTLSALDAQELDRQRFEVIVVDNGSSDDTLERLRKRPEESIPLRVIAHPAGGPAAARNAGVEAAHGEIVLFLGDDTEPESPGLLRAHLDLHAVRPDEPYGVLGRITWSPRSPVTPFMRWLENGGPQFSFCDISPGAVDPSMFFYSSHVSVKRALFERVGGFDPRFPYAAVEDTELGVRLAEAGLELDYHPELVVWHDHPTTLPRSLDRATTVGRSAALYNEIRPDRPHESIAPPTGLARRALGRAAPAIKRLARYPLPAALQKRMWRTMHYASYWQGYRRGPPSR